MAEKKGFFDSIGLGSIFGEADTEAAKQPSYLGSIDGTTEFGKSGGTITAGNKAMSGGKVIGSYDPDTGIINQIPGSADTATAPSLFSNAADLATFAGGATKIYSDLFGDNADIHDKKMEAMNASIDLQKQQKKANKQAMKDRAQFNAGWANASNGLGKVNV